jgi:hypothetical protein
MTAHAARVLAFAASLACAPEPPLTPAPTITSTAFVRQSALDEITAGRCTREQACGNIGPARKYPSFGTCLTRLMPDSRAIVRLEDCPRGTNDRALTTCIDEIHKEACASPLDTIDPLASCTHGLLCNK